MSRVETYEVVPLGESSVTVLRCEEMEVEEPRMK
jgi:hypothetical protein